MSMLREVLIFNCPLAQTLDIGESQFKTNSMVSSGPLI